MLVRLKPDIYQHFSATSWSNMGIFFCCWMTASSYTNFDNEKNLAANQKTKKKIRRITGGQRYITVRDLHIFQIRSLLICVSPLIFIYYRQTNCCKDHSITDLTTYAELISACSFLNIHIIKISFKWKFQLLLSPALYVTGNFFVRCFVFEKNYEVKFEVMLKSHAPRLNLTIASNCRPLTPNLVEISSITMEIKHTGRRRAATS